MLQSGWTIVGRAIGDNGPVTKAFATCWRLDGARVGYFDHSDTDGRFAIRVPQQEEVERVIVRNAVFGQGDAIVKRTTSGSIVDVGDVILRPANTVRGRVVSPSGRGLPNLPVKIHVDGVSQFDAVWGMSHGFFTTDAGGAFAFHGLAAGPRGVSIQNAMMGALADITGDWGAAERTIVANGARVTVAFEWQRQQIPASLLHVEWLPSEGEYTGPGVPSWFDDRLVPFDSRWMVRASLGDRARGETLVEVGQREEVHCVVQLQ